MVAKALVNSNLSVEEVQSAQPEATAADALSVEASKESHIARPAIIDKLFIYMRRVAVGYEKAFLIRRNELSAAWLVDTLQLLYSKLIICLSF